MASVRDYRSNVSRSGIVNRWISSIASILVIAGREEEEEKEVIE